MIKVYSKENCNACVRTKNDLHDLGIEFEELSLHDLSGIQFAAFVEAGHRAAPIVVTDNDEWSGYQPDLIKGLVRG